MKRVLVVDDEEVLARSICRYLNKRGVQADYVLNATDALATFDQTPKPDITFIDYRIGGDDGVELLSALCKEHPDMIAIIITGHGDIDLAVRAMKAGAKDFLIKPIILSNIAEITTTLLKTRVVEEPGSTAHTAQSAILGRSPAATELRQSIGRIVHAVGAMERDLPAVLITGESGTGKELIARALHQDGPRADRPFVTINCAALPADLVESELFGHIRGAFTDAKQSQPGLFEVADGGVLFLDEIGDMPQPVQAKLLRVLEERTVRRIGARDDQPVDVWIIAATNQRLSELVAKRRFRADLMYRLQVLWIDAAPLRERDADILVLANEFLRHSAERYRTQPAQLSAKARAQLISHPWPGNVRELRNVIERAVLAAEDGVIEELHIILASAQAADTTSLQTMEVSMLQSALEKSQGNVTRAARILGISRDTMRYRMTKHGLSK